MTPAQWHALGAGPAGVPPWRVRLQVAVHILGSAYVEVEVGRAPRRSASCSAATWAQELLCELEDIVHRNRQRPAAPGVNWHDITVVVDSPLAADFTAGYGKLKAHWCRSSAASCPSGELKLDPAGAPAHRADDDLDVVAQLRHQFQQLGFTDAAELAAGDA